MIDDGGPAFPVPPETFGPSGDIAHAPFDGMTLRDYLAAKAIAECIRIAADQTPKRGKVDLRLSVLFDKAGVYAYVVADAMLKVRKE